MPATTEVRYTAILTKEAVPFGGINGTRRRWHPVAYTVENRGARQVKVARFLRMGSDADSLLALAAERAALLNGERG